MDFGQSQPRSLIVSDGTGGEVKSYSDVLAKLIELEGPMYKNASMCHKLILVRIRLIPKSLAKRQNPCLVHILIRALVCRKKSHETRGGGGSL